jgi:hypothetical protein
MGWLQRLLNRRAGDDALGQWRKAWAEAAAHPDAEQARNLRARLDRLSESIDDVEIEREMLDGLDRVVEFAAVVGTAGLPAIATGHRVIGADVCHFSAPASMPDDPAQPSGRLLLTNVRAIFVGGARGVTVPWHATAHPLQGERDLILVRSDGSALYRFRCNSFDDALCGAFIARRLAGRRRV